MSHAIRSSRLLRAALLGSITVTALLTALAAPTFAAGSTRWVDDDGHAGSTGCSDSKTARTSIQKAIDASGTGDVIKVCPGTYTGRLSVSGARDGLTLVSVSNHAAVVKAPSGAGTGLPIVSIDHVDHVTIKGFAVRARTSGSCRAWSGISAAGAKYLAVTSNDLRPTGTDTDHCGLWHGIVARAGTTGTIKGNLVKDFRADAIRVRDAGTRVDVTENDLRFYHLQAFYVFEGQGIDIAHGGTAKVIENQVTSPATAGHTTPSLGAGIQFDNPGAGTDIRFNTMHHLGNGIRGFEGSNLLIRDNSFVDGQGGITLQDIDDSDLNGNLSTGNAFGIYVQSASIGNTISSNDFRNNSSSDCTDDSSGSGTSNTANHWKLDKGTTDIHPQGLCQ